MSRPNPPIRAAGILVAIPLTLSVAACGQTIGISGSPSTSISPSAAATDSSPASASPTANAPSAHCTLPVRLAATVNRAQITDLEVAAHDGYDRIVYTFATGLPQVTLEQATPPFTRDAGGAPIVVRGTSFLRLVLHGGTIQLPAGGVSYNGALSMTPHFDRLVDLQAAGDFEAVSSWYLGLAGTSCVRAFALESPSRLVIDVQQ